jgi:FkbM family methyltransferase
MGLLSWARRLQGSLSAGPTTRGHPIFSRFETFDRVVQPGFYVDFTGSVTEHAFVNADPGGSVSEVNEEYFEWIDLLSSVQTAQGSYTVVEVGAGYGRWAARGALAARQRGLEPRAILVEGEPRHAEWAKRHMLNNGITDFRVIEAAAGALRGETRFAVMSFDDDWTAESWYGQFMSRGKGEATDIRYHGKTVYRDGKWGLVAVDVLPLADILDGLDHVDLLDMDIQGSEAEVIEAGVASLDEKVSFLHVATHTPEIHNKVRELMAGREWRPIWDFPVGATCETPYGPVAFQDGVLSWRLAE